MWIFVTPTSCFLSYTASGDIPFPPTHFRHTCLCMGLKTFDGWEILQKLAVFTGFRLIEASLDVRRIVLYRVVHPCPFNPVVLTLGETSLF